MNNLTVNGNLVKDLEVKPYGKDGILAKFTVANNERAGQNEVTSFINCTMFGEKRIEALQKYLVKGCKVLLSGRLQIDNIYDDENDTYKTYTNVVVDNLEIEKFIEQEESNSKKYNKYSKRK